MRTHSILVALVATAGLAAQTSTNTIKTATDFGALVTSGTESNFRSAAKDTTVTRGLSVWAILGRYWTASQARSSISPTGSFTLGRGVRVSESGNAFGSAATSDVNVGSSDSAPNATNPAFGDHGTSLNVKLDKGKKAKVTILWTARASMAGATATASVDVDGDNNPDFTAKQSDSSLKKEIEVTAGDTGIDIAITTGGKASIQGKGSAFYSTNLSVYVNTGDTGGKCTFTAFGKECGGKLTGSAREFGKGAWVTLSIAGAAKSAVGVMVVGTQLKNPLKLPGSSCTLDVDPNALMTFRTDAEGNGRETLFVRDTTNANIDMQGITLAITSKGAELASTNGLNLTCK